MVAKKKSNRDLPENVLREELQDVFHLEAESVQNKFSNPDSIFGEENVDIVAFTYMTPEAILYWLPTYLDYLRHDAPDDSFHYESLLYHLADEKFVEAVRKLSTSDERDLILAYLDWWESTLTPVEKEITGRKLPKIRELWR